MTGQNRPEMEPWRQYVDLRLHAGATREEIIAELAAKGWSPDSAREFIYWVEDGIRYKQAVQGARWQKWAARRWHMLCGGTVFWPEQV